MDEAEDVHEVPLPAGHVAQPARGEDGAVGGSEGGKGDAQRHQPSHGAQDPVTRGNILRNRLV